MTHLSPEALARYLIHTSPSAERETVEWHLEHCPTCIEEVTVRDLVMAVKEARKRLVQAVRAVERN